MSEVNRSLMAVKGLMEELVGLSGGFKGRDSVMLGGEEVGASEWKANIRRAQTRVGQFYELRMRHFDAVNDAMGLGLSLERIEGKEWGRDCVSKMNSFCICG